nr:helix-turn-helix domain-containing protein [Clostridium chromiireducens]
MLYEKKQCTQIEVCQYLGVEAPTITRTLTRMEEMGLVIQICEEINAVKEALTMKSVW